MCTCFNMQLMLLHLVGVTDGQQNREGPGPSKQLAGSVEVFESEKKKERITHCFFFSYQSTWAKESK